LVSSVFPPNTIVTEITDSQHIKVNNNANSDNNNATLSIYQNPPIPIAVIQMYVRLAWNSLVQKRWQEEWCVAMGWFIAHYCTLYAETDGQEVLTIVQSMIHGEVPQGTKPGTVFTVTEAPTNGTFQGLYKNGVFQTPAIDYNLVGNVITMIK